MILLTKRRERSAGEPIRSCGIWWPNFSSRLTADACAFTRQSDAALESEMPGKQPTYDIEMPQFSEPSWARALATIPSVCFRRVVCWQGISRETSSQRTALSAIHLFSLCRWVENDRSPRRCGTIRAA